MIRFTFVMLLVLMLAGTHAKGQPGFSTLTPTESPFGYLPTNNNNTVGYPRQGGMSFGDFDGDGLVDVIGDDAATIPFIHWFKNLGGGAYSQVINEFLPAYPQSNLSSYWNLRFDFDGDGMPDLLVCCGGIVSNPVLLLRRPGTATGFAPAIPTPSPIAPSGLSEFPMLYDITLDGIPEVVLMTDNSVLQNPDQWIRTRKFDRSTVSFVQLAVMQLPRMRGYRLLPTHDYQVDLNHDGVGDLAIEAPVPGTPSGEIVPVLVSRDSLGAYGMSLGTPVSMGCCQTVGRGSNTFIDLDRDGNLDYITQLNGPHWARGDGSGGFYSHQQIFQPTLPTFSALPGEFRIADFDQDGYLDVLLLRSGSSVSLTGWHHQLWLELHSGTSTPLAFASPKIKLLAESLSSCGIPQPIPYTFVYGRFDLEDDGDLDTGVWSPGLWGSHLCYGAELYGIVRNDTIMAKGCSFSGPVPVIDVGPTLSGHTGSIGVRRATPGDQAFLFVSNGTQAFNGCGGMIPNLTGLLGPNGIFYSATVSDAGTASFSYTLPPSATPINASLYMQWVVVDATNPFAIRLSDLRKVVLW